MPEPMSSTDPDKVPPVPTLDDMLATFDKVLAVPEPIGELLGAVVYLHHDKRELSWTGNPGVSVDHPYLIGTPIRDAALRRLGERS